MKRSGASSVSGWVWSLAVWASLAGCALFDEPPAPPAASDDTGIFNNGGDDVGDEVGDVGGEEIGEDSGEEIGEDAPPDGGPCMGGLAPNVCGGCGSLGGAVGDACGACGGGALACEGMALACVGAASPTRYLRDRDGDGFGDDADAMELCAATGLYTATGGGDCNDSRADVRPGLDEGCDGFDNDCDDQIDEGARNACGGCAALTGAPGAECGECGEGLWACAGEEAVRCEGPGVNACGGCGVLSDEPGAGCGQCGVFTCEGVDALRCDDPGQNACGGCVALQAAPGGPCGACGSWVCQGLDSVQCDDPGANACGGCGALSGAPGGVCATYGEYACSGQEALTCLPRQPVVDSGTRVCSALNGSAGACPVAGAERQDGDLLVFPPQYTTNGDVVTDEVTGLRWQRTQAPPVVFASAAGRCPAGFRLPSRLELLSLNDYGRTPPVVPAETFIVEDGGWYWTSTPYADGTRQWAVHAGEGFVWPMARTELAAVRCVQGESLAPSFVEMPEVVIDATSGLMWQRHVTALAGDANAAWGLMLRTCRELALGGFNDWRLPTIKELLTLVREGEMLAIDPALFTNSMSAANPQEFFWAGTFGINNPVSAWGINFNVGGGYPSGATNNGHDGSGAGQIRCVRNLTLQ